MFGKGPVDDAIGQIRDVLAGWGYYRRCERDLTAVICHVLLLNRSPRLEDLSGETLARLRTDPAMGQYMPGDLHGVHRAVAALGHVEPPAAPKYGDGPAVITGAADAWADWVERWHATSTLAPVTRGIYRVVLAKMGRWLAGEHPEITEPGHWTRQTCAAWVAAVDRMAVGDYSQSLEGKRGRVGEPLSPKTRSSYLRMARAFFRDLQEWEWIPRRFDPAKALGAPRSLRALLGPDPRVIADDIWAKLLWAGLNLDAADLPRADRRVHPFEMIRAITLTWLFSGQRSDEIARLRVGCVRWQHDGVPIASDSDQVLARDVVLPAGRPHPQDRHGVHQARRPPAGQGHRGMAGRPARSAEDAGPQDQRTGGVLVRRPRQAGRQALHQREDHPGALPQGRSPRQ